MAAAACTWKMLCPIALVLLGLTVGVRSAAVGVVANFSVNGNQSSYVQVNIGQSLTIVCRVVSNSTVSVVHINKVDPNNRTWHLTENEYTGDDFNPAWPQQQPVVTMNLPANTVEYTLTIPSAQNGDTGNYSCIGGPEKSGAIAKYIQVDVLTEATGVVLSLTSLTAMPYTTMSYTTLYNTVQVTVGQMYQLSCTVYGGNPYPVVNLTTYRGTVSNAMTTNGTNATYNSVTGMVNRYTTVTVSQWTVDSSLLGRQVTCTGGVKTPNAVSASFVPTSSTAAPQFTCGDTVSFPTGQTDLTIGCQVFAPNLTSSYVLWVNSTNYNNSVAGILGTKYQYPSDQRYSLLTSALPNGFYWMNLTIARANTVVDLTKNRYQFVAINNNGKGLHSVTVQSSYGGPTSGVQPVIPSMVSALLTLLIAAAAAAAMMI